MREQELTRRLRRQKIISRIMQVIKKNPFDAWLVGGSIRNTALGIRSRDYDIVVTRDAKTCAASLARIMDGNFFCLDHEWGEYRVMLPRKRCIDIKTIRTIEEDLAERDFTMNAIALDLRNGKNLHDPHGGLKDIENRQVKSVSESIFKADPLRLLRMFRLGSTLGFSITRKALALARESAHLITKVPAERIRVELLLMMENHHSFPYVKKMDQVGLLAALFPELEKGKQIPQHKYRSANLKDHSLVCYDIMECIIREERYRVFHPYNHLFARFVRQHSTMLKLAALLHDIGKLYTMRTDEEGVVHFWTHERKGALRLKEDYQHKLCLSKKEVALLSLLIIHHMRAHLLSRETSLTNHAKYRFIKDGGDAVPGILLVTYADSIASSGKGKEVRRVECTVLALMHYYASAGKVKARKRLVTGHDLMKQFRLKPSPLFKTILDAVEHAQVNGTIKNKREALAFVEHLLPTLKQ